MGKKNSKKSEPNPSSIGFSSKGKKKNEPSKPSTAVNEDRLTKKQIIALIAIAVAAITVAGIIIGAVASSRVSTDPDFMTYDLSKYITIDEEDYKGYIIDIPLDYYTDDLLTREINILRASKKALNETYKGGYVNYNPLSLGDQAHIYYRGYKLDEDGREVGFLGLSNFLSDEMTVIEVGTGEVVDYGGIENPYLPTTELAEALVGKVPKDYTSFKKIREGSILAGDVIYLSYTVMGEDGDKNVSCERIDLSLPYINEKYGDGFVEFFIGSNSIEKPIEPKQIGESITYEKIVRLEGHSTDTVYSDMKVEFVTRCESEPLTVSVELPASYLQKSLRGVTVYFDLYIAYAEIYDVPEFNDKFITDSLEVSESELSSYKGENLVDKYKSKLTEKINKELEQSNHELLEEAMFEHILARTEVKMLPPDTVDSYVQSSISTLEASYKSYGGDFSSIDEYARALYGLDSGASYEDYFEEEAKLAVTEKLIFYYIIREENFIPSDSEFEKIREQLYNDILTYYLELHDAEFSKLEGEEYEKELKILKDEIDSYYGEEYFRENVYYYYGTRKMLELCTLTQ